MDETGWHVREEDFPADSSFQEKMKFFLRYAILAPSSHNTQPWRFGIGRDQISVFADFSRSLPVADPDNRELYISIGCSIENIILASIHFGYVPLVTYFPEGMGSDCVARIKFSEGDTSETEYGDLFDSIPLRHTNRSLYERKQISDDILAKLKKCTSEGVRVDFISDNRKKSQIAGLVNEGDLIQFNYPAYRKELGYWIGQGVFGHKGFVASIGQFLMSNLNPGKRVGRSDKKLIENCPVFAVMSSVENDKLLWLKTGESYQRIALLATSLGLVQHPINQGLLEVPSCRDRLKDIVGIDTIPHFAFRLGYAAPGKHQVRRILDEVCFDETKRRV